jgi:hypothetical protein
MDFEANRGRTMASASVSPAPLKSEHSFERANNALSPPSYPLAVPHNQAKSEIAYAPNLTHVATRTSAAAPIIPLPSTRPLPKLTADWSSTTPLPRPRPSGVPHGQTKPEIAHAPNPTRIATLTPTAAAASPLPGTLPLSPKLSFKWSNTAALPRPRPSKQENARSPVGQAASQVAEARTPPPSTAEKPVIPQQAHSNSTALLSPDSRTAVYDIAAHTVYLPSGDRLEAHSGLGSMLDDPSYVNVKRRGPTPPNVYDLTLREQLFHGVQAIRLNPVEDDKMFGRDGMLAHSYMLGPNGQSNGCVSFRDYPKFLQAFLSGEVDRLIVVPDLGTEPSRTARARSGNVGQYAFNNR